MDNSFVKDSMENHQLVKLFYTEFEESRKRAWLPRDYVFKCGERFEENREKLCGSKIKALDFLTLRPHEWLNDVIIDCYFDLITQRSRDNPSLPKVWNFNCFFYVNYVRKAPKDRSHANWVAVNIFDYDMLLIPFNKNENHWIVVVVDMHSKIIAGFDSKSEQNTYHLEHVRKFLDEETKKEGLDLLEWELFNDKCPRQQNGYDCGVYACQAAQFVTKKQSLNYSQIEMNYFRKRMKYELLVGKLID